MTLPELLIVLVVLFMSLRQKQIRPCPKLGLKPKKRRRPLQRKSTFRTYENAFKTYKTDHPDVIRRKAEQCRAEQRAANNPAEIGCAGILNQIGATFDPLRDYQRIVYLPDDRNPKGYFVPDWVLDTYRAVIEVDGKTHLLTKKSDERKDRWFAERGYKVIRILAKDIFHHRADVVLRLKQELGL
jgi:hypothetical protein